MGSTNQLLVLDTSAFIMGLDAAYVDSPSYTTPAVVKEIHARSAQLRLTVAMEAGKLTILTPSRQMLKIARSASTQLGDRRSLSEADLSVIALALELKAGEGDVLLVSDDYAVQNVAHHLQISHTGLSTRGITSKIRWVLRCRSCGKLLPSTAQYETCPVCGGPISRKAAERMRLPSRKR
ncbi:MAG: NOB1 family endonuclease [Candidatus Bathyarchaeia archaeon]